MDELRDATDVDLVAAVGRYGEDALGELFRRHCGAVQSVARKVLASDGLAEDVVQEVFLRLWNHPDRFDPARGSLRSYLLTIAHRRAVDLVRSDVSRRRREDRRHRVTSDPSYDLEQEIWDLTTADRMAVALRHLPDVERTAIELAYFTGHTYREVARLLGCAEGTIKSRIRTGLLRLRGELADMQPDGPWPR